MQGYLDIMHEIAQTGETKIVVDGSKMSIPQEMATEEVMVIGHGI